MFYLIVFNKKETLRVNFYLIVLGIFVN